MGASAKIKRAGKSRPSKNGGPIKKGGPTKKGGPIKKGKPFKKGGPVRKGKPFKKGKPIKKLNNKSVRNEMMKLKRAETKLPIDEEPIDEQSVDEQPIAEKPIDELVDSGSDASGDEDVVTTNEVPTTNEAVKDEEVPRDRKKQRERRKFDFDANERTIFVGNLPKTFDTRDVEKLFKWCGPIESSRIRCVVPEKEKLPPKVALITGRMHPKVDSVKAYVVFKTNENGETVKKALTMNGKVIDGHHLRVDIAQRPKEKRMTLGGRKKSIFVGNLRFDLRDDDLYNYFEKVGPINYVRIVRDSGTGMGKGFGFVVFEDRISVKKALDLDNSNFKGRSIRVKKIEEEDKKGGKKSPGKVEKKSSEKTQNNSPKADDKKPFVKKNVGIGENKELPQVNPPTPKTDVEQAKIVEINDNKIDADEVAPTKTIEKKPILKSFKKPFQKNDIRKEKKSFAKGPAKFVKTKFNKNDKRGPKPSANVGGFKRTKERKDRGKGKKVRFNADL